MEFIAACFFPTSIFLIDDESKILRELKNTLSQKTATYKTFSNPFKALSCIQKEDFYLEKWLGNGYHKIKEQDYSWRDQIYSSERFDQVSTVVVDYTMPGMNGLEFCAHIQDTSIQKIILTGEADESIAIKAFNEGLIQGFIKKNDLKVFDKLNAMIHKRQLEFFKSLTQWTIEGAKEDIFGTVLQDPEFIRIFQDILTKFNIVEYYLIDAVGKFLLLDSEGQVSALLVYNEQERQSLPDSEAEIYFSKNREFIFPSDNVQNPFSMHQEKSIGQIKGQKEKPYHEFPIYEIAGKAGYTWGYIPRLKSLNKIHSFEAYKNNTSE